jgi:hypothetical protein
VLILENLAHQLQKFRVVVDHSYARCHHRPSDQIAIEDTPRPIRCRAADDWD